MRTILSGLREGGLTIAYNGIVWARGIGRRLLRPRTAGVRALVLRDGQLLLVRHRGGQRPWSLPGGGVAHHEPLDAAAEREVREEGGCTVTVGPLLGLYHHFGEGMSNYVAVFVCTAHGPARPPVGDLEIADARFFSPHDLPAGTEAGTLRRIAEHARGEQGLYRQW